MKNKNEINLFFTGGWDSTFMLCKLSRQTFKITPVYVLNKNRESHDIELDAAKQIIRELLRHPQTKATIEPMKMVSLEEIKIDPAVTAARKRLIKRVGPLGYQYDYLSTIAKKIGQVGIGLEYDPNGDTGETRILTNLVKLIPKPYGYIIDEKSSDPDANLVFGRMFFPIQDVTEPEMYEWAKKNGYDAIMNLAWFCHSPINGQPCGLCHPCEGKMQSGMKFLLPKESQERFYRAKKYDILGKVPSHFIKNLIRHCIEAKQ